MTALFSQILNMSLTGSIVILFVLAARLLLKKAPKIYSYVLWAAVLFRLLCPFSMQSPLSVLNLTQPTIRVYHGSTTLGNTLSYLSSEADQKAPEILDAPTTIPVPIRQPESDTPQEVFMEIGTIAWMTGMAAMALYSGYDYLHLRRKLREAVPLRSNIYRADRLASPFVLGVFYPKIYLPSDTPVHEQRYIVAHERHHIRRGDHIIKLIAYAALCLHWFNPLVWIAFLLAGQDMEMSCDEAVIKKLGSHIRADYCQSLLRLSTHPRRVTGTPLSFGEGDPKGRVRNIVRWATPKQWVRILCLFLCAALLAACALNPEDETMPDLDTKGSCDIGIGDLYFILPQGYTMEWAGESAYSEDFYNHSFTTDGVTPIGGVDSWPTPDLELDTKQGIKFDEYLRAMGLPEIQESNEPIARMMGSSPYCDFEATFYHELQPDKLREVHHFFITEKIVYDMWFDQNQISDSEIRKFVETAALYDGPVLPTTEPELDPVPGSDIQTEFVIHQNQFASKDETVNFNINILLPSESGWQEDWMPVGDLIDIGEEVLKETTANDYGLNLDIYPDPVRLDIPISTLWHGEKEGQMPTLIFCGFVVHTFANGDVLSTMETAEPMLALDARDGSILYLRGNPEQSVITAKRMAELYS